MDEIWIYLAGLATGIAGSGPLFFLLGRGKRK
jgi:hypothetical protein